MPTIGSRGFQLIDRNGHDVTGTERVAGYSIRDFFACDLTTATDEEIASSYRGPDSDGIAVRWSAAEAG